MVGLTTTAVFFAAGLDPRRSDNPRALVKGFGLNLKEYSSGKGKSGSLRITKRGQGEPRRYLYLVALRAIRHDPIVKAWYRRLVERVRTGARIKAIVGVMRKLALAIWHVGGGAKFDAEQLFDVRHLAGLSA